ncbi:hypothetical protein [Massilia sp. Se16.2.3]|uniref:hypothetical protein n=1 Tax=Massilia sp. Se16.2.3 TaxID=2709303 RepID=UPI0016034214|nr:hypothetical protein [Massilia sp. Se16.2.3]QNB00280.1 hypothetical protein G4G31_18080 [Massilia sp. Se16.2.3]
MLSRLRIGPKLLLAPGVVLVLLVLLSSGAWYAMVRQNASLEDIVGQRAAHMRAASELVFTAQRSHAEIYQLHTWIGGSFPRRRIEPLIADIHRQHALTHAGLERVARMTPAGSAGGAMSTRPRPPMRCTCVPCATRSNWCAMTSRSAPTP